MNKAIPYQGVKINLLILNQFSSINLVFVPSCSRVVVPWRPLRCVFSFDVILRLRRGNSAAVGLAMLVRRAAPLRMPAGLRPRISAG